MIDVMTLVYVIGSVLATGMFGSYFVDQIDRRTNK